MPPPPPCSADPVVGNQTCEIEGQYCPGTTESKCLKFDGTQCINPFEGMMTDCVCDGGVWNCVDGRFTDEGLLEDECRPDCSVCASLNLSTEELESGTCSEVGQYCNGPTAICEKWNGQACVRYETPRYCLCNGATWDCDETVFCEPYYPTSPSSPWDDLGPACPFATWDESSGSLIPLTASDISCDAENVPVCYATDLPVCDFSADPICDSAPEFFCICEESGSWTCPFYEFGFFPLGDESGNEETPPTTNQTGDSSNEIPPACPFDAPSDGDVSCVATESPSCETDVAWTVCESNDGDETCISTIEFTVLCLCSDEGVWSCPSESGLLTSLGLPPDASVESKSDDAFSSANVTTETFQEEDPSATPYGKKSTAILSSNIDAESSACALSKSVLPKAIGLLVWVLFG